MSSRARLIQSLRLSQFLYVSLRDLRGSRKHRASLVSLLVVWLGASVKGVVAPLELIALGTYQSDTFRYLFTRARFMFHAVAPALDRFVIRLILRLAKGQPLVLAVDDTMVEKDPRSTKLPVGGKRGAKVGFSFVTATLRIGDIWLPLVPRLVFRKSVAEARGLPYIPKTLMAESLMRTWHRLGLAEAPVTVVLDSWYGSARIVTAVRALGWTVIVAVKRNRRFRTQAAQVSGRGASRVEDLRKGWEPDRIRFSRGEYWYTLTPKSGTLRGIAEQVRLVISRRERPDGRVTWRYLAAIGPLQDPREILDTYALRWSVEVFHRVWKYWWNPAAWRIQSVTGIERMTIVTALAMTFSAWRMIQQSPSAAMRWNEEDRGCLLAAACSETRTEIHSWEAPSRE